MTTSYAKLSDLEAGEIGSYTRENVDRVRILLPARLIVHVLAIPESFLQCRLRPCYEGFKSQRE
jgi:hypothetical protein